MGTISVRFQNGVEGFISHSQCYRGSRTQGVQIIIQGERACITSDENETTIVTAEGEQISPPFEGRWFPNAFGHLMTHFVDALDTGQPFLCSGRENLTVIGLIEAAYRSAAERRVVEWSELFKDNS